MERILVVEDDKIIGSGIRHFLEEKGMEVSLAGDVRTAETLFAGGVGAVLKQSGSAVRSGSAAVPAAQSGVAAAWALILLDWNLPDGSGLAFCKKVRESSRVPIIFLTAKDTKEDMIEGFRAGCDDYIAKPFDLELLYQRILAVLRRSRDDRERELFRYGGLTVDLARMQVFCGNVPVKLSATEYKLLELLIKNRGQVLTRQNILERIWDCDENFVDENTLNVHIRRLRKKLEEDAANPKYIVTVFGIGYTFGE